MLRQTLIPAALAALGAALFPLAAPAYTAVAVPQPLGQSCTSVKIANKGATSWANMNCSNGLAYAIKNKSILIPLVLPGGGLSEEVRDIDQIGQSVGFVTMASGAVDPYLWKPNGSPILLPPHSNAVATGIPHPGGKIVGFNNPNGIPQALYITPGTILIGPAPVTGSKLHDVSVNNVYVGELNGTAAIGLHPGAIAPIPGVSSPSVALQIMDKNVTVGAQEFLGVCGTGVPGSGFMYTYPAGPLNVINPLAGDCTASAEDINDNYFVVGKSSLGIAGSDEAELYANAVYTNLNTLAGHPWVQLTDATGIDDANSILATDGGAVLTQVYVIN